MLSLTSTTISIDEPTARRARRSGFAADRPSAVRFRAL
jgi:hypothetical protein